MGSTHHRSGPLLGRRRVLPALFLLSVAGAGATTITVDLGNSAVDPRDGQCSLREAVSAANDDTGSGPVAGECPAGSGADTIRLTTDVTLTVVDNPDNGLPVVTTDIIVEGGGHTIARATDAAPFRIWNVVGDLAHLTLKELTVSNGSVSQPGSDLAGGVSCQEFGRLSLVHSRVTGNNGSGIYSQGIPGYPDGEIEITNSEITGNSEAGIAIFYPDITISGSTISGNDGHGIRNEGGSVTLSDSVVSVNGMGIKNSGVIGFGRVTITHSTISGNGFGISSLQGSVTVDYSTIAHNLGPGIANYEGPVTISNSTISGNAGWASGYPSQFYSDSYGSASLTNSTISGSGSGSSGGGPLVLIRFGNIRGTIIGDNASGPNCADVGQLNDLGGNLADDTTCGTIPGTLNGVDPLLADNGGPTRTHALLPGSSAVDAAGACGLATDQRGFPRDDGACDSGAFERAPCGDETCNGLDDDCDGLVDEEGTQVDADGDQVPGACDNCLAVWNPSQTDVDADLEGDACDLDDGLIYLLPRTQTLLEWQVESGFDGWNLYRGDLTILRSGGAYTQDPGAVALAGRHCGLVETELEDDVALGPGDAVFYLVTGISGGMEGGLGPDGDAGLPRPNDHPCPAAPE